MAGRADRGTSSWPTRTTNAPALRALAEQPAAGRIAVMVDSTEQLAPLERAIGSAVQGTVRVCIDVDAGWRTLDGRVRIGVERSPTHTPEQAAELAGEIVARRSLALVGVMMYEAQIAGLGSGPPAGRCARISVEHILPNILNTLVVQVTIQFSLGILAEAALAYVGLGAEPPTPEWGKMQADAQDLLRSRLAPHLVLIPGLCIVFTVLGLNLMGDGLRDVFDPRLQQGRQ